MAYDPGEITLTINEYILSLYRQQQSKSFYNGFDQSIYASQHLFKSRPSIDDLIKVLNSSVYLDNATYLNVTPSQQLIPVHDVFKTEQSSYIVSTKAIEGKIGLNQTAKTLIDVLSDPMIYIAKPNKTGVVINSLIVILMNEKTFQHMSAIILSDVTVYGFETNWQQESLPSQYIHSFVAKDIIFADYSYIEMKKHHTILKYLSKGGAKT